jgi:hypothetical protein
VTGEQERLQGMHAHEVLDNPAFDAAFAALESELLDAWKSSRDKPTEYREGLFVRLDVLCEVKGKLSAMVAAGQIADTRLRATNKL